MKNKLFFFVVGFVFGILFRMYVEKLNQPLVSPVPDNWIELRELVKEVEGKEMEWVGEASWYGTGKGECLGCSKTLTMANGQRLDDNKFTVACGLKSSCKYLKLGTRILITNLKNSKQAEAIVTDKGGLRQGRLLDVSRAVKNALEMDGLGQVKFKIIK